MGEYACLADYNFVLAQLVGKKHGNYLIGCVAHAGEIRYLMHISSN